MFWSVRRLEDDSDDEVTTTYSQDKNIDGSWACFFQLPPVSSSFAVPRFPSSEL